MTTEVLQVVITDTQFLEILFISLQSMILQTRTLELDLNSI